MIFYFSGTGNSAYAALKIAEKTGEEVCDIGALLKEGKTWEQPVKTAVFVTPTYAWRIPKAVSGWIRKSSFGMPKAWFVMTCGDENGDAASYNRSLCTDMHMNYMGTGMLIMPENYTALYDTPDPDAAKRIIRKAEPELAAYADCIRREQAFREPRTSPVDKIKSRWVNPAFYRFLVGDAKFRVNDSCISCGKCVQGCPLNNIRFEDGKPVWGGNCTHCMACINYCPMEAIEYGAKSRKRYHYTCPF